MNLRPHCQPSAPPRLYFSTENEPEPSLLGVEAAGLWQRPEGNAVLSARPGQGLVTWSGEAWSRALARDPSWNSSIGVYCLTSAAGGVRGGVGLSALGIRGGAEKGQKGGCGAVATVHEGRAAFDRV